MLCLVMGVLFTGSQVRAGTQNGALEPRPSPQVVVFQLQAVHT